MSVTRWTVVKVESWVSKSCPVVGVLAVSILPRMAEAVWEGEVGIGEWDVEREERRSVEVCADRKSHWSNGSAKLLPVRKHVSY